MNLWDPRAVLQNLLSGVVWARSLLAAHWNGPAADRPWMVGLATLAPSAAGSARGIVCFLATPIAHVRRSTSGIRRCDPEHALPSFVRERVWNLPRLPQAAASEHSATATSTLARQSQAGCTGGAPDDAVPRMASSRVESDVGVVARLVDPMKMSSLMQDKTDTELNSDGSFANIGHLPILDQPTSSLQIPSSPAPVPPPDGKLCIHRRHWANLERQPSELPAEHGAGAAAEHAFVQPPPPPPACSRPSSYQLVD